ncbi:MAG: hypothetical protein ACXVNM_06665 [Bacteroidia bacterium]
MKKLIYIFAFSIVILIANFLYTKLGLYDQDIKKCNADLLYKLDTALNKNNILYLGESSNFTFSELDTNKKSISELVAAFNKDFKILDISKGAIHTETYKTLIKRIENNLHIKTIILTVNLRSFGINWIESTLETNLSRANILYSNYPPIIKKFMLSFKAYDNKDDFKRKEIIRQHYKRDHFKLKTKKYETVYAWDADVYDKGILNEQGIKDKEKTEVACHFIKNYAFKLTDENRRVKDLDEIVKYCREKNISLIFNLLPENHEKATTLCGEDLTVLMRQNVDFLEKRYNKTTQFINSFAILPDSCFIDKGWPTEHYNYAGRKAVAEKINEKLNTFIP